MARTTLTPIQSSREVSSSPVVKPLAQPVFDPTKAALKQSLESSSRVDPFSEAMREAYDNDWSEAASRSSLGHISQDRNEVDRVSERVRKNSITAREAVPVRAPGQETTEQPEFKAESGSLTEIGKLNKSDAIEQATARAAKSSGLTRHEMLMRLSVTMSREQTSTFGSEEPAKKVMARRTHFLWARDPLRAHNLRVAEMLAALGA